MDDLGINKDYINDLNSPPSLSIASNLGSPTIIDDTDDDLDELPLEETTPGELTLKSVKKRAYVQKLATTHCLLFIVGTYKN